MPRLRQALNALPGLRHALACLMLGALAACGGGQTTASGSGVGEGGTGAPVATASVGVVNGLDASTLTVNGATFDRQSARIEAASGETLDEAALKPGMWVQVEGNSDDTGGAAVATVIRIQPALRGEVSSVDGGNSTVTVLDNSVAVGSSTLMDGYTGELAVGDLVEVHGPLSATAGVVQASRIDKLPGLDTQRWPYQLKGKVSLLDATAHTMTVGGKQVDFGSAVVTLPRSLVNGMVVRVAGSAAPRSGQPWVVEQLTVDQALPLNLGFLYVEGYTSQWQSGPRFQIDNLDVDASTANGKAQLTRDGQRVAVIGSLRNGSMVAKSVTVVVDGNAPVFTLSGPVKGYVSLADFTLRSVAVDASSAVFQAGSASDLANEVKVKVVGRVVGRKLVAGKITVLPATP
jgi:hypothetical protein